MIPKSEHVECHGMTCVTQKVIEKYHGEESAQILKALNNGHTAAILDTGETGYYVHDYWRECESVWLSREALIGSAMDAAKS